MTIRYFNHSDLDNGFLETLEALAPVVLDKELQRPIADWRHDHGITTLVAVEQEKVIGTASLVIEHKFIHGGSLAGRIEDVAVHKDHQGKGIGKALVQACVNFAKDIHCYKVTLSCNINNIAFYSKLGFRPHETDMRIDL